MFEGWNDGPMERGEVGPSMSTPVWVERVKPGC